ncbi:cytidine deaminase [Spartinivicinus ruber]|uniref:cytidine deaminase n=1 Tax=Spartinivicinus ruber TaxID=2683272 RepID=UPI0013D15AB4|nr:cytidine deaminase [Spartinivicinus ruber]
MNIGEQLYQAAMRLSEKRYPVDFGGAAAIRTQSGKILTSVAPDTKNDALALCMEVGALLVEAHILNEIVTHSLCIYRESEKADYLILSPCNICQERVVHWGGNVQVTISNQQNQLIFKTIRELQPYHWSIVNGETL